MELENRKKIFRQLRKYDGALKKVASELHFTPDYVRNVMTRVEGSKSEGMITTAVITEIAKRHAEHTAELEKIFATVYSK